jgi:hypothetical protein
MALSKCVKRKSTYRKIYEQHYGPIGKDSNGRSLEVHHINGDHEDNRIENLKAVTIEEHYAIHKAQGDYVSAFMIAQRMELSPQELSDIASKSITMVNARRIKEGTHNFLDSEAARQRNLKRVKAGTHNLLKQADGSSQSANMVAASKHHFVKNNPTHKKMNDGTHHFLTGHPNKLQVTCLVCHRTGGYSNMKRYHLDNCKALKILPVAL